MTGDYAAWSAEDVARHVARLVAERDQAEAAVARVRALCDEEEQRSSRWVVRNIRAALNGPSAPEETP